MLSSPLLLPFLQSREGKGRADSVNASVCTTASCFQVFSVYDAFLKWKCGSASPDAVWVYHDPGVGGWGLHLPSGPGPGCASSFA